LELHLRLVHTGHVGEGDHLLVTQEHARPALAEAHGLVVGALRLAEHEEDEEADEQDGQERREQEPDPGTALVGGLGLEGDALRGALCAWPCADPRELVIQLRQGTGELAGDDHRLAVLADLGGGDQHAVTLGHHLGDPALLDEGFE
jgi:hypothetical protein